MLSKILKLTAVQQLNKEQQRSINGGLQYPIGCRTRRDCFIATGERDWACALRNPSIPSQGRICIPL